MTSFIQLYPLCGLILHYTWFVMHSLIYDFWISTRVCCNTKINEGNTVCEYIFPLSIYFFTPPHHTSSTFHLTCCWIKLVKSFTTTDARNVERRKMSFRFCCDNNMLFWNYYVFWLCFWGLPDPVNWNQTESKNPLTKRHRFPKKGTTKSQQ